VYSVLSTDSGHARCRLGFHLACLLTCLSASGLVSCSDSGPGESGGSRPDGSGRTRARADGPRLVVLFAVCTLNKEYLSPYNPEVEYTPTLGELAQAGVVFDRHHTEAGQSGTAYASLFSGSQADTHKIYTHPNVLDDRLYLMAEAFRDSGWQPWYWYGHPMAEPKLNYGQGVAQDHLVDFNVEDPDILRLTPQDPELVALLRELEADPERHVQITINFSYTHGPYEEGRSLEAYDELARAYPEEVPLSHAQMEHWIAVWLAERHALQWNFPETREKMGLSDDDVEKIATAIEIAYKSGVYMLDRRLGLFLKTIQQAGLQDELLLAFTADHGQVLYRENAMFQWTHGLQLAPEVLNVPLILFSPEHLEPGRYEAVSRSIDIYPMLAGLAGVEIPGDAPVAGYDLSSALLGTEPAPELTAYFHSTTINPKMFQRTRSWTLMHSFFPDTEPESLWVGARKEDTHYKWRTLEDGSWAAEIYDLSTEGGAGINVYDASNAEHNAMIRELQTYKSLLEAGFHATEAPDDALKRLQDMGYVGGDEEE